MKKLLFISALLLLSIKGFSQKADSIAFCEVRVFQNSSMGPHYIYNVTTPGINGKASIGDNHQCDFEIAAIQKLGADGWHLIAVREERGEISALMYVMEKTYKRK
jgi:hypothetical protein